MKKIRSISTILALIMLWSISFHSLASSQGDENLPGPKNKDIFTSTASVVNTTADKSFDAESASVTTIVQTDVDDTFVVNFQCKLAEALERDLTYTLLIIQTDDGIFINYHDSLENNATPGFIFVLENDEPVKMILDENSEILKDGQSMNLDFWEELTVVHVGTVKADTFEADDNIIDLTFTLIATEGEQQIIESIEPSPGNDAGEENSMETPKEEHELVDLTDKDIVFEASIYRTTTGSIAEKASIEEKDTGTIIKVFGRTAFDVDVSYYALPVYCNPVECNTRVEANDNSFTIHFQTELGEERSHTYTFISESEKYPNISLSFSTSYKTLNVDTISSFGGLSMKECLFGQRGITDLVCYNASKFTIDVTASVKEGNETSVTESSNMNADNALEITNQNNGKESPTSKIDSSQSRSGIALFIPTWLIKTLLSILAIVLIYLTGKKQLVETKILPKLLSVIAKVKAKTDTKINSKEDEGP